MATEPLYVPEEDLMEVIRIIRSGLKNEKKVPRHVRQGLVKWCNEEEKYWKNY